MAQVIHAGVEGVREGELKVRGNVVDAAASASSLSSPMPMSGSPDRAGGGVDPSDFSSATFANSGFSQHRSNGLIDRGTEMSNLKDQPSLASDGPKHSVCGAGPAISAGANPVGAPSTADGKGKAVVVPMPASTNYSEFLFSFARPLLVWGTAFCDGLVGRFAHKVNGEYDRMWDFGRMTGLSRRELYSAIVSGDLEGAAAHAKRLDRARDPELKKISKLALLGKSDELEDELNKFKEREDARRQKI